MKAKEKETVRSIANALRLLPIEKQEFIKGYAEGVIAMGGMARKEEAQPKERAG